MIHSLEYKFRHKNDLPVVTKKFSDVARLTIADMRKQLDASLGRKVYEDYIVCIERYLIPVLWRTVCDLNRLPKNPRLLRVATDKDGP